MMICANCGKKFRGLVIQKQRKSNRDSKKIRKESAMLIGAIL